MQSHGYAFVHHHTHMHSIRALCIIFTPHTNRQVASIDDSGASAFVGLGTYTYWSGHRTLNANKSIIDKSRGVNLAARRLGITGTAAALVGLGIYRLFG